MEALKIEDSVCGRQIGVTTTLTEKVNFKSESNEVDYNFRAVYDMKDERKKLLFTEIKKSGGDTKLRHSADGNYTLFTHRGELEFFLGVNDHDSFEILEGTCIIPSAISKREIIDLANHLEDRRREGIMLLNCKKDGLSW